MDWTGCTEVFVDTSRNGHRAYCSAKCGNYVAVQRHRSRQ
ncbi:CGNR zinc finger domain-containing protein [Corynebacterium glutamicum]